MSNLQARKIGTWTQSGSMKDLAAFYALVIKHRWKKGVRFDVNRVTLTAGVRKAAFHAPYPSLLPGHETYTEGKALVFGLVKIRLLYLVWRDRGVPIPLVPAPQSRDREFRLHLTYSKRPQSRSLKLAIFERLKDEGQNRIFEDWRRFVEWVSDPELCIIIEGDIEICLVLFIHKGDLITTDPSSRYPMCQTCIEERVSEKGGTYVRLRRDLSLSPAQIKCVLEHLEARYARDEVAKREHLHRISGGLSSRPRSLSSGSLELVVGLE
ncbi:uncharacterized protein CcaverHIS019_0203000 [Cutaneotrichosporon cavernicola]|uniref:Uncharacterized protein n=1 Tax=Cutaneotrichosporon cavernicola TaxID=279322 RepID=A0AA48IID2_9TREE|nr:uncharacterized protein CcaverHIS019_0203000 [Cutaneotrichosporon cavernicola]BEI88938.1 hypothetical protein CcaverHIS019_0203000 [Cutaneotrichosporon cavernicola]